MEGQIRVVWEAPRKARFLRSAMYRQREAFRLLKKKIRGRPYRPFPITGLPESCNPRIVRYEGVEARVVEYFDLYVGKVRYQLDVVLGE